MLADSHMHTKVFSSDASQTIEEVIEASKALGISNVSITEHYDMDYPHKDEIFTFDLNEYGKIFPKWQALSAYKRGPSLHMGIEIGWQPHLNDRIIKTVNALPFDTVLLSAHVFRGTEIFYSTECPLIPRKDRNKEYISLLTRMARELNCYDIIAHYDYINRYIDDKSSAVFYHDCPEQFDELFEVLISKDKALEVNTSSIDKQMSKGSSFVMPDPDIIKRYLAMGGKLITLGSDAHKSDRIGLHFIETAKYLKSLGVSEVFYYENRHPVSDPEFSSIA